VTPSSLTLGYVPGGTPAKWARIWAERHREVPLTLHAVSAAAAAEHVRAGNVDVALLRLPTDTSGLAVIPLYDEATVVVVPTDHLLSAADEVTSAEARQRREAAKYALEQELAPNFGLRILHLAAAMRTGRSQKAT
jgi:DNA-binding transcriptional LysR family regulator